MKMMMEKKKYKFLKWFIIYFKIHGHITSISVLRSYRKLGLAAKDRLIEMLGDGVFTLQSHGVGKYGRCLGEIFKENEVSLNRQLINEGHATEYFGGKR